MKTQFLFFIGTLFLFYACDVQDEFNTCEDNPIENVAWIKDLVEEQSVINCTDCSLEIIQYNYEGNTVFSVDNCLGCSDALITVYDCDKAVVCEFGGITGLNTCEDFETEAIDQGIVFSNRIMENPITKIEFQNSFGSCLDYCMHTIEIENQKLRFTSTDWQNELEPITCEYPLTDLEWNLLQNELDIDLFLTLEEVYGCLDCADGGASFIEIELPTGETKKMAFEFENPPSIIAEYATSLQILLDGSNRCKDIPVADDCDKKVIISKDAFNALPASPIEAVSIEGNCMFITYSLLSTQDPLEDAFLIDSGLLMESFPVQRSLKFHVTESLTKPTSVQATTSFDISDLAAWNEEQVILNIEGFDEQIVFERRAQCGDPNVTCIPVTQAAELKCLQLMLEELQVISSITACKTTKDILLTPVGSKACGGPQLYLPYTASINVEEFLSKVEIYTMAEKQYNLNWGIISTCDVVLPPSVICNNGEPVLVNTLGLDKN